MPDPNQMQAFAAKLRAAMGGPKSYTQLYNNITTPAPLMAPEQANVYDLGQVDEIRRRAALENVDSGLPKLASAAPVTVAAQGPGAAPAGSNPVTASLPRLKPYPRPPRPKAPSLEEQAAALRAALNTEASDARARPVAVAPALERSQ